MTRLQDLYTEQNQSPWLDNLKRGWITSGELERWVERGVRGITSNPSIFQKAMETGDAYDSQLRTLAADKTPILDSYWDLVTADIEDALRILRPVYDASGGEDGYVSVEVAPSLARDTDGTIDAARHLHTTIDQPNLYVKIPGTAEGVPAIQQMISEKRSINVTLLFSIERYAEVIEAYLAGPRSGRGRPVGDLVGGLVLHQPGRHRGRPAARRGRHRRGDGAQGQGRGRQRQARLPALPRALQRSPVGRAGRPRAPASSDRCGRRPPPRTRPTPTRSTSMRSSGPTRSTPSPTPRSTRSTTTAPWPAPIDADVDEARATIAGLAEVGVDLADVTRVLEDEGVAAFSKSFDELIDVLQAKSDGFGA